MKFKYWALSLLACGGMLSCTNEDVVDSSNGKGETSTSYLAVNILNTGAPGTRADEEFEDGEAAENAIDKVRFYFFDKDGGAFPVNGTKNYKDIERPTVNDDAPANDNIAKVTDAMLVLQSVKGTPVSMVAVVNPANLDDNNKSLAELKAATADYSGLNTSGTFVMSNSVYADGSSTVCETLVGPYLYDTQKDATDNPVNVYVERVLAKVKVTFTGEDMSATDGMKMYDVGTDDQGAKVYAKIYGWQVADYRNASYLLKSIDPTWTNDNLGFSATSPWTSADYHRSFWATSTGDRTNSYAWDGITTASGSWVYTQENTPTDPIADPKANELTKVIVAAQLVNADGTPKARYQYMGKEYTGLDAILALIAPDFRNYYIKTGATTDATSYQALSTSELVFVKGSTVSGGNQYKMYPQLKSTFEAAVADANNKVYEVENGTFVEVDRDEVNSKLMKYYAQAWEKGYAYYYTTIKHLGSADKVGEYGVVRNHVYNVTISDITGFGTPVYDPTEVIIPQTPSDDASYLAAKINVLSWRVVNSSVTLGGE